uniref:Uncharacterized protein n=3 Tax=Tetranychus urticae TaxID=32264 RepID=T1KQG4_TETUR
MPTPSAIVSSNGLSSIFNDQSLNGEITCSASIVGADCEDTEFTLDWQYPKVNNKTESAYLSSDNHFNSHHRSNHSSENKNRKRSQSTGYLNESSSIVDGQLNDNIEMRSSESWTQFLLKSRGSSMTSLNEVHNSPGLGKSLDPTGRTVLGYGSSTPGKRSSSQLSSSGKCRNLASSLQSYFFSGGNSNNPNESINVIKTSNSSSSSSSSQKSKSAERQSIKDSLDSSKSFPLPNVFKKNFIAKGHSNCGLFSGAKNSSTSSSSSKSSEILNSNVNKNLHRELNLAAKEIGAFY